MLGGLSVRNDGGFNSPGSSVFDLPHQQPYTKTFKTHPSTLPQSSRGNVSEVTVESASAASFIIISGGTGGNSICSAFGDACYVLPVSDDGGSSSEIIRVLGGPSIGDIRSRLVRLIPCAPLSSQLNPIRNLLAYRLPAHCSERDAREEWRDIVEGRSELWRGILNDRKETLRGFFVYFESELLKRAHKNFDFRNGSIGNYFIAAAQGFFRSLPSAIFLFSSITNSQAHILPVIVTNHTVTIAAELENGERLVGQCEISHPISNTVPFAIAVYDERHCGSRMDETVKPRRQNSMYDRRNGETYEPLPSRILRLYYINSYGVEIHPTPNPEFLANLSLRDVLVYSCGSLWTSIIPCLALCGVSSAIARSPSLRAKVLLLNADNDRETDGYTAVDYISAIVRTLNANYGVRQYGLGNASTMYPASAFITDLVYLKGTKVNVYERDITKLGIKCTEVAPMDTKDAGALRFEGEAVRDVLAKIWTDRQLEIGRL